MDKQKELSEKKVRKLIKELSEKYGVPLPKLRFYPKPRLISRPSGNIYMVVGCFHKCRIEFYGKPTLSDVKHEFTHYLKHHGWYQKENQKRQ